ncbi:MAG: hypothetical protein ACI364_05800 [Coriobacteriales bacterium]
MSKQAAAYISPELDNLTCELIGVCLDALAEDGQTPPTIACLSTEGEASWRTFSEDGPDAALAAARRTIRRERSDIRAYAVAYDGFIRQDARSQPVDALLVEFAERGMPTAYSAYVAYRKGDTPDQFTVSDPLAAGEEPNLLV